MFICHNNAVKTVINGIKIVIYGILPHDEQNTVRRQELFIVNKLLESKCTNYVNTDIHYLSPDGDWIRENGCLDISLFYKDKLHLIDKIYLKSVFSKKNVLIQKTSRKDKNHFLTLTISHLYDPNQTQTQTNKITRRP